MNHWRINRFKIGIMANKNLVELGRRTRFSSTNQPKNSGRKPKLYTQFKSEHKISQEEYREVTQYIMQLPKTEVEELAGAEGTPIWVVTICRAFLTDVEKGSFNMLSDLTDRMFGKPKQVTENYNKNTERNRAIVVFSKPDNERE